MAKEETKTFMSVIADAKLVIGTVSVIIAAVIGGWSIATEVFVTRAYADAVYMKHINRNDSQTSYNKLFILGQRIDTLVKKKNTTSLSPEETRQLEDLRRDYIKVSAHIKRIENKDYLDNSLVN